MLPAPDLRMSTFSFCHLCETWEAKERRHQLFDMRLSSLAVSLPHMLDMVHSTFIATQHIQQHGPPRHNVARTAKTQHYSLVLQPAAPQQISTILSESLRVQPGVTVYPLEMAHAVP
eukprot:4862863-Pyramimonas_sp.AAC.1